MAIIVTIVLGLTVLVYFLPTIIGWRRGLRNAGSIFCVNLLLGWTLIGWAAALAWSVSGTAAKRV